MMDVEPHKEKEKEIEIEKKIVVIEEEVAIAPITSFLDENGEDKPNTCLPIALQSLKLTGEAWRKDNNLTHEGVQLVNECLHLRSKRVVRLEKMYQKQMKVESGGDLPEIVKPVFIVGWIRTGSTFLHNFLTSSLPTFYAPPLWQLLYPFTKTLEEEEEAVKKTTKEMEDFFSEYPSFRSIHNLEARLPDECCHLLECLGLDRQWVVMGDHMEEYRKWMLSLTKTEVVCIYKRYKHLLQTMLAYEMKKRQQQQPSQPIRLLLKDNIHMLFLDSLLEVFPDASVLCLSRSPRTVFSSSCSAWSLLSSLYHGKEKQEGEEKLLAQKVVQDLINSSSRVMAVQTSYLHCKQDEPADSSFPSPFLNIVYEEMMQNPMATFRLICKKIGYPLSESTERSALEVVSTPKKHGQHSYSPQTWLSYLPREGKEEEEEMLCCGEIKKYMEFVSTHFRE